MSECQTKQKIRLNNKISTEKVPIAFAALLLPPQAKPLFINQIWKKITNFYHTKKMSKHKEFAKIWNITWEMRINSHSVWLSATQCAVLIHKAQKSQTFLKKPKYNFTRYIFAYVQCGLWEVSYVVFLVSSICSGGV